MISRVGIRKTRSHSSPVTLQIQIIQLPPATLAETLAGTKPSHLRLRTHSNDGLPVKEKQKGVLMGGENETGEGVKVIVLSFVLIEGTPAQ